MKKPYWINKKINFKDMHYLEDKIKDINIKTVCHQARCPNISECFKKGTMTFLILGDICTRNCSFCNVKKGRPENIDKMEPYKVLESIKRLNLKFVVITSVTRDDLEDGGAKIFADTIRIIKNYNKDIKVEVLIPDFKGDKKSIKAVVDANPDIISHNIETVPSLYNIRKGASYNRSLNVLEYIKEFSNIKTKSGIMLGLGEAEEEIITVFKDLRKVNTDFLSIGQYLQPDKNHYEVKEYISPSKFEYYKKIALDMGFLHVESGVYVRSSYMAENYLKGEKILS